MLVNGPENIIRPVDTTNDNHTPDRPQHHPSGAIPRALHRRLTDTDRASIINAYHAGASINQLTTDWQLAKASILSILRTGGATIRKQRRLTDTEINHAITSYQQGESLARIGQRLGVAHTTIRTALRRRGIDRRDTHGRQR
ncbi:helix-turn-helix domain-containing protein [Nocardia wallacei]|uniref:helix-turn-helix domain-containing protein n=1 Tax=Nocardia wallacei TaxID=480035 RepID=UPI002453A5BC|nr:helix-turn-helix domain-containing protein [Nocardia wallacei]